MPASPAEPVVLRRMAAFATASGGGNPAGVWIGPALPDPATMLAIAREVGYSETAFLAPATGRERTVRFYSPEAEVALCGHATIAAGAVLAGHDLLEPVESVESVDPADPVDPGATFRFLTAAGEVRVECAMEDGEAFVSLTSVEPDHEPAPEALLDRSLAALGWNRGELDPTIPPARAFAGAWHLVIAAATRDRLARLDYDFDALRRVMEADGLTTLQLLWREAADLFHARAPFPVGGVVEDPATGAAAAALGGYLRDAGLVPAPGRFTILQGEDMGRPSELRVECGATGGVTVAGRARPIEDGAG